MSLLSNIDEYDIRVGLSYYDHPVAAADDDGLDLNLGMLTRVKVRIEEV